MKPIYEPKGKAKEYGDYAINKENEHSPFSQPLSKNPNWKGGTTITSHGYRKIKVPDHPYADVAGYVYEHRLVMEKMIGRYLNPGEIVHHLNENTLDNSPDNLVLNSSIAEHKTFHRKRRDLQEPGEENYLIPCSCGCGNQILKYDEFGRPRNYINGHHKRLLNAGERAKIQRLNIDGMSTREIAKRYGISKSLVWKITKEDLV